MKFIICALLGLLIGIGIGYEIWGNPTLVGNSPRISAKQNLGSGSFITFNVSSGDSVFVTSELLGSGKNKATDVRLSGGGPQPITGPSGLAGHLVHLCSDPSAAGWSVTTPGMYRIDPFLDPDPTKKCSGPPPTGLHTFPPLVESYDIILNGKLCKMDRYVYDCGFGDKTQITIIMIAP